MGYFALAEIFPFRNSRSQQLQYLISRLLFPVFLYGAAPERKNEVYNVIKVLRDFTDLLHVVLIT